MGINPLHIAKPNPNARIETLSLAAQSSSQI
ncbi:hypothetical protein EV292_11371 [Sphingomonas sp. BK235]|nr:hypothetical protein EV292_11371 [Sphingomonas sp. BK235]